MLLQWTVFSLSHMTTQVWHPFQEEAQETIVRAWVQPPAMPPRTLTHSLLLWYRVFGGGDNTYLMPLWPSLQEKKKGAFQMGHDYVEKSLGDILRLNLLDNPSYRHPGMAVQLGEYVITVYIATLLLSQRGFC